MAFNICLKKLILSTCAIWMQEPSAHRLSLRSTVDNRRYLTRKESCKVTNTQVEKSIKCCAQYCVLKTQQRRSDRMRSRTFELPSLEGNVPSSWGKILIYIFFSRDHGIQHWRSFTWNGQNYLREENLPFSSWNFADFSFPGRVELVTGRGVEVRWCTMVGMVVGMAGEVLASWKCNCLLGGMVGEVLPGEGI